MRKALTRLGFYFIGLGIGIYIGTYKEEILLPALLGGLAGFLAQRLPAQED